MKRGSGCCAINDLFHSSLNLVFKQCKLHNILFSEWRITQWNKAGTIWCHHLSTKEGAINRICFTPTSCERFSTRNRIMPVPGQWCRSQIIPASCERGLNHKHSHSPEVHVGLQQHLSI